jgi:CBS domain-containing protein
MSETMSRKLPVRVRRIAAGDGEGSQTLTVYCRDRAETVALSECETCPRCDGITLDATGRDSFLMCRLSNVERGAQAWNRLAKKLMPAAASRTVIADVMTRDVQCVTADVSVEALTAMFIERGVSGAPVVDEEGLPIGIVTKTDLVRMQYEEAGDVEIDERPLHVRSRGVEVELPPGFHAERIARATVGEIMMPLAFTLEETQPLAHACALMAVEGVHRLPIVGSDGKIVGILSSLDVLRWVAQQ